MSLSSTQPTGAQIALFRALIGGATLVWTDWVGKPTLQSFHHGRWLEEDYPRSIVNISVLDGHLSEERTATGYAYTLTPLGLEATA